MIDMLYTKQILVLSKIPDGITTNDALPLKNTPREQLSDTGITLVRRPWTPARRKAQEIRKLQKAATVKKRVPVPRSKTWTPARRASCDAARLKRQHAPVLGTDDIEILRKNSRFKKKNVYGLLELMTKNWTERPSPRMLLEPYFNKRTARRREQAAMIEALEKACEDAVTKKWMADSPSEYCDPFVAIAAKFPISKILQQVVQAEVIGQKKNQSLTDFTRQKLKQKFKMKHKNFLIKKDEVHALNKMPSALANKVRRHYKLPPWMNQLTFSKVPLSYAPATLTKVFSGPANLDFQGPYDVYDSNTITLKDKRYPSWLSDIIYVSRKIGPFTKVRYRQRRSVLARPRLLKRRKKPPVLSAGCKLQSNAKALAKHMSRISDLQTWLDEPSIFVKHRYRKIKRSVRHLGEKRLKMRPHPIVVRLRFKRLRRWGPRLKKVFSVERTFFKKHTDRVHEIYRFGDLYGGVKRDTLDYAYYNRVKFYFASRFRPTWHWSLSQAAFFARGLRQWVARDLRPNFLKYYHYLVKCFPRVPLPKVIGPRPTWTREESAAYSVRIAKRVHRYHTWYYLLRCALNSNNPPAGMERTLSYTGGKLIRMQPTAALFFTTSVWAPARRRTISKLGFRYYAGLEHDLGLGFLSFARLLLLHLSICSTQLSKIRVPARRRRLYRIRALNARPSSRSARLAFFKTARLRGKRIWIHSRFRLLFATARVVNTVYNQGLSRYIRETTRWRFLRPKRLKRRLFRGKRKRRRYHRVQQTIRLPLVSYHEPNWDVISTFPAYAALNVPSKRPSAGECPDWVGQPVWSAKAILSVYSDDIAARNSPRWIKLRMQWYCRQVFATLIRHVYVFYHLQKVFPGYGTPVIWSWLAIEYQPSEVFTVTLDSLDDLWFIHYFLVFCWYFCSFVFVAGAHNFDDRWMLLKYISPDSESRLDWCLNHRFRLNVSPIDGYRNTMHHLDIRFFEHLYKNRYFVDETEAILFAFDLDKISRLIHAMCVSLSCNKIEATDLSIRKFASIVFAEDNINEFSEQQRYILEEALKYRDFPQTFEEPDFSKRPPAVWAGIIRTVFDHNKKPKL